MLTPLTSPSEDAVSRSRTAQELVDRIKSADLDELQRKVGRPIDRAQFEDLREELLTVYDGMEIEHTAADRDGHPIDCIPAEQQPVLRQLRRTFSRQPPSPVRSSYIDHEAPGEPILLRSTTRSPSCPPGTIPMRRITLETVARFGSLKNFFLRKGSAAQKLRAPQTGAFDRRYAHASQVVNNHGALASINIWSPRPTAQQLSCSQVWVTGGQGDQLQTIEAGWMVNLQDNPTTAPVLFVFYTPDNYASGGYNEAGFAQDPGSSWQLGGEFPNISQPGGSQYEVRLGWKRNADGNWCLLIQSGSELTQVGLFHQSLFGQGPLASHASKVDFGGEVSGNPSGQMGSGELASSGYGHAAYQRRITYFGTDGQEHPANLIPQQTNPGCYTIDLHAQDRANWGGYFYFGGGGCVSA